MLRRRSKAAICGATATSSLSPASHVPSPSFPQNCRLSGWDPPLRRLQSRAGSSGCAITTFAPASIPLARETSKTSQNSSQSKGVLPAQLLSSPSPTTVVLLDGGIMLTHRQGSGMGSVRKSPRWQRLPGNGSHFPAWWRPRGRGAAGSIALWTPHCAAASAGLCEGQVFRHM